MPQPPAPDPVHSSFPTHPSPAVQPILALLACPVAGNPLQYMIEKAFAHHNLDWRYLTFEVVPNDLPDAVRGMRAMGFRGGAAADPHREAILPLLGRVTDVARIVGVANLILRDGDNFVGDNSEGRGLVELLGRVTDPKGKRYLILGAGQTARAVAAEIAGAGAAEIRIMNRTADRATQWASRLAEGFPSVTATALPWEGECRVPEDIDVLIHATSFLRNSPGSHLPLATESFRPELIVADMTVSSPATVLLCDAAAKGCKTIDGLSALIEQVAVEFRLWTSIDPDRQVLREAVEEFLEL